MNQSPLPRLPLLLWLLLPGPCFTCHQKLLLRQMPESASLEVATILSQSRSRGLSKTTTKLIRELKEKDRHPGSPHPSTQTRDRRFRASDIGHTCQVSRFES